MKKKQYASMQEELAARKAAAGYTEEPRARINATETNEAGDTDRERRKRTVRIWLSLALALFFISLVVGVFLPDGDIEVETGSPFEEVTTDEEIIEYIDERWSIDPQDSRAKIKLLSWKYKHKDNFEFDGVEDWDLDVSENFVIIKTACPEDADPDDYDTDYRAASDMVQYQLQEDGFDVPVAIIARYEDTGDLMMVLINGAEYFPSY